MKISELVGEELIIDELKSKTKLEVLDEFSSLLYENEKIGDREGLARVLAARESLGSTGIGDGVAIPHGKLNSIPETIVAFGRSRRGVDYQSLDAKPVFLFFLLVTPVDRPGDHLKTLARISRILKNPALRADLKQAPHRQDIQRLIFEEDGKYPQPQPLAQK